MAKARTGWEGEFYREVGAMIRRSREAAGLSQDQLAGLVGLSRTSVVNLEAGRQAVPLHVLALVAERLSVGTADLLPRRDRPPHQPLTSKRPVPDGLVARITEALGA